MTGKNNGRDMAAGLFEEADQNTGFSIVQLLSSDVYNDETDDVFCNTFV